MKGILKTGGRISPILYWSVDRWITAFASVVASSSSFFQVLVVVFWFSRGPTPTRGKGKGTREAWKVGGLGLSGLWGLSVNWQWIVKGTFSSSIPPLGWMHSSYIYVQEKWQKSQQLEIYMCGNRRISQPMCMRCFILLVNNKVLSTPLGSLCLFIKKPFACEVN